MRKEEPDFIALTGDLISGQVFDWGDYGHTWWARKVDSLFKYIET